MFRYLVFSIFITNFLLTFHGFQSEASSIHFLSTDILKEVEDHAQGSFEEYGDIKDKYEKDDSKRTRQKRYISDWTQRTYCSGSLELTSTHHNFMKIVSAEKLRRHDRTVKLIRARNPETKSRLQFEIVTATGNCAWTVHENRRGGRKKRISPVDTIFTEWPIKRVKLLEE